MKVSMQTKIIYSKGDDKHVNNGTKTSYAYFYYDGLNNCGKLGAFDSLSAIAPVTFDSPINISGGVITVGTNDLTLPNILVNKISEKTLNSGVTIDSNLIPNYDINCAGTSTLRINTIAEKTASNGVVISNDLRTNSIKSVGTNDDIIIRANDSGTTKFDCPMGIIEIINSGDPTAELGLSISGNINIFEESGWISHSKIYHATNIGTYSVLYGFHQITLNNLGNTIFPGKVLVDTIQSSTETNTGSVYGVTVSNGGIVVSGLVGNSSWISGAIGSTSPTNNTIVIGTDTFGNSVIGSHSGALNAWKPIKINSYGNGSATGESVDISCVDKLITMIGMPVLPNKTDFSISGAVGMIARTGNNLSYHNGTAWDTVAMTSGNTSITSGTIYVNNLSSYGTGNIDMNFYTQGNGLFFFDTSSIIDQVVMKIYSGTNSVNGINIGKDDADCISYGYNYNATDPNAYFGVSKSSTFYNGLALYMDRTAITNGPLYVGSITPYSANFTTYNYMKIGPYYTTESCFGYDSTLHALVYYDNVPSKRVISSAPGEFSSNYMFDKIQEHENTLKSINTNNNEYGIENKTYNFLIKKFEEINFTLSEIEKKNMLLNVENKILTKKLNEIEKLIYK
jgi:hypothetical protein